MLQSFGDYGRYFGVKRTNHKFHINDIPDNVTVDTYILQNTDLVDQIEKFDIDTSSILEYDVELDIPKLKEAVQNAYDVHGWYGFLISGYIDDESIVHREQRSDRYGGLSITYNPYYKQKINVNCQTLGNVRYNLPFDMWAGPLGGQIFERVNIAGHEIRAEFYDRVSKEGPGSAWRYLKTQKIITEDEFNSKRDGFDNAGYNDKALNQVGKNTYSDCLGFNKLTPSCSEGYLGYVMKSTDRTMVRGRVVTMKHGNLHWHRDEPYYVNFRLNLPLYDDPSTRLKTEKHTSVLKAGKIYHWDTGEPHCIERTDEQINKRVNVVFGVSPWFDFDPHNEMWYANEFYGEMHPWDMLKNGYIVDFVNER